MDWAKSTDLWGFRDISLYDVLMFCIQEIRRDNIVARSQSIAFTFFLSIFPALLVIFTLLPLLPIDVRIVDTLEDNIYRVLPGQSGSIAMELIRDILTRPRGALLSLSFVLATYFSSNGMMRLMRSFDKRAYKSTFRRRNLVRSRFIALGLTLGVSILLYGSLLLITAGNSIVLWLADRHGLPLSTRIWLGALQYLGFLIFVYTGIAGVYRYGAATYRRFPFFTPGALLASLLILATSLAFAIYVDRLENFNQLYGSIGTVIVFLLWLQFNILWILLGYELNASIAVVSDQRRPDTEEEDKM